MPDPINSNLLTNTCGDPIGSNCVIWQGPAIPGVSICKGASITDVIYNISKCSCSSTPSNPCSTGNWIDFSSTIPNTSGTGAGGLTWNIGGYGVGGMDNPMYKWTSEGDLSIRGSLVFTTTGQNLPTVVNFIDIPLCIIPKNCYPANFTKDQFVLVDVHGAISNGYVSTYLIARLILRQATGVLSISFEYGTPFINGNEFGINLNSRFNLS